MPGPFPGGAQTAKSRGLCKAPRNVLPREFVAYNTAMAKKAAPIEVACPCCHTKLTVDPQLAVVLSHEPPPRTAPGVDLTDAKGILAEQEKRREDKFRESWAAEQKKEDVLTRKFEEALKKAKDQPLEKPVRDFDLE
jgi:hypothetical protein